MAKLGQTVQVVDAVPGFGGRVGTVVGHAGLVCEGAVYVALPGVLVGGGLPGVPFDLDEIRVVA